MAETCLDCQNRASQHYWGDVKAPMPINKDGADAVVRSGAAYGPGNFGTTEGKYEPSGNYKSR